MGELARLCAKDDMEPGTARRFVVGGCPIALVRIDDEFYALCDTCSHEDYSLSEGEVFAEELEIECPKHGSTFDLLTGDPRSLPATKPVSVFKVQLEGDGVMVEIP